jgi:hypothetical protein
MDLKVVKTVKYETAQGSQNIEFTFQVLSRLSLYPKIVSFGSAGRGLEPGFKLPR